VLFSVENVGFVFGEWVQVFPSGILLVFAAGAARVFLLRWGRFCGLSLHVGLIVADGQLRQEVTIQRQLRRQSDEAVSIPVKPLNENRL